MNDDHIAAFGGIKFSIIIPVYNVAHPVGASFAARHSGSGDTYLHECLASVLAQTYASWEAICVDDGSTDGSGAILDEYAARDSRFRVIHQSQCGVAAARNTALATATGDWICFLDSDDLFTPDMLTVGVELICENPGCDLVRVGAAVFKDGNDPRQAEPFSGGLLNGVFATGFYRRSKFGSVRFADYIVGEDRVYAATCVFQTGPVAEGRAIGYLYRQRETSVSHIAMTPRKAQDWFLHVAELLKLMAASGRPPEVGFRRALVAQILERGAVNCRQLTGSARYEVEQCWRACLADLQKEGLLTPWGNFASTLLRIFPFAAMTFILCVVPYRLKRMGVRR